MNFRMVQVLRAQINSNKNLQGMWLLFFFVVVVVVFFALDIAQ